MAQFVLKHRTTSGRNIEVKPQTTVENHELTNSSHPVSSNVVKQSLDSLKTNVSNSINNIIDGATNNTFKKVEDAMADKAPSNHNQAASTITDGTLNGKVQANATAAAILGDAQVRDIIISTTDLTAGTSELPAGTVYIVYE